LMLFFRVEHAYVVIDYIPNKPSILVINQW